MKLFTNIGSGKIYHGLIHPILSKALNEDVFYLSIVRNSEKWKNVQKSGFLKVILENSNGNMVSSVVWPIKQEHESLDLFIQRCLARNINNGIVIVNDIEDLNYIISQSYIFSTSMGITGLRELISKLINIKGLNLPYIFAFENKPQAIQDISSDFNLNSKGINLIYCPIDRVIVSRTFYNSHSIMRIKLGGR